MADEEAIIVAFRKHTLLPLDDCLKATEPWLKAGDGPYSIHHAFGWRNRRIRHAICDMNAAEISQSSITKLKGWEWRAILARLSNKKRGVAENSLMASLLDQSRELRGSAHASCLPRSCKTATAQP